jgi:ankyrin repeat protein
MHRAARASNVTAMTALANAGANVNLADKTGTTPLHLAARSDEPAVANLLLKHGAQVDVRDKFGCTPLHDATHARGENVVAMLIAAGAKRDAANAYGVTPLQLAERTHRPAIAGIMNGTQTPTVASTAELAAEKQGPDEPIPSSTAKKPTDEAATAAGN